MDFLRRIGNTIGSSLIVDFKPGEAPVTKDNVEILLPEPEQGPVAPVAPKDPTTYVLTEQDHEDVAAAAKMLSDSITESLGVHSRLISSFESLKEFIPDEGKRWQAALVTSGLDVATFKDIIADVENSAKVKAQEMLNGVAEVYQKTFVELNSKAESQGQTTQALMERRDLLTKHLAEAEDAITQSLAHGAELDIKVAQYYAKTSTKLDAIKQAADLVFPSFNFPKDL